MSVTVSDLLKLPSLRQARVTAERAAKRVVSSISVLESTVRGPDHEVFRHNKYSGARSYHRLS